MGAGKAGILKAARVRTAKVVIDGMDLTVRELSAGERSLVQQTAKVDAAALPPLLMRLCVLDSDGRAMFTEEDQADIDALRPEFVDAVAVEVMKLSGLSEDDPEKKP